MPHKQLLLSVVRLYSTMTLLQYRQLIYALVMNVILLIYVGVVKRQR